MRRASRCKGRAHNAREDPSLWNYGKMSSRIHKVAFTLTDNLASGERSYDFADSFLYAVPLEKGMQYGSGNPEIRPSAM